METQNMAQLDGCLPIRPILHVGTASNLQSCKLTCLSVWSKVV